MTDIAVIVNTAALGSIAGDIRSSGDVPHRERVALLESLLRRLTTDPWVSEVVVAGEWREPRSDEAWRYVWAPSVNFDCTDALRQRELGAKATTSPLLVFLHDDHLPRADFFPILALHNREEPDVDVWVPSRVCQRDGQEVVLNNGSPNYVMGHCCAMRRAAWERTPWTHVPPVFTWDIGHTLQLRAAGAKIAYAPDLVVEDTEALIGATPWV